MRKDANIPLSPARRNTSLNLGEQRKNQAKEDLAAIISNLSYDGYHPIVQLADWLMTGDPTYITNRGGRGKRYKANAQLREDALYILVETYIAKLKTEDQYIIYGHPDDLT